MSNQSDSDCPHTCVEGADMSRSITTSEKLASVMVGFHPDRTAGKAAALGAATRVNLWRPCTVLSLVAVVIVYNSQTDELKGIIMGTTTSASFKPLMAAFISAVPSNVQWLYDLDQKYEARAVKSLYLILPIIESIRRLENLCMMVFPSLENSYPNDICGSFVELLS